MGFALAFLALLLYSTNIIVTKLAGGKLDLDLGVSVAATANVVFGVVLLGFQVASKGIPLRPDPTAQCTRWPAPGTSVAPPQAERKTASNRSRKEQRFLSCTWLPPPERGLRLPGTRAGSEPAVDPPLYPL